MAFDETSTPRAADGKFAEKVGASSEVTLGVESKADRRERVKRVLLDAHAEIPAQWVYSRSDRAGQASVRAAFRTVAEMTDGLDLNELDYPDRQAVTAIRDISAGTDPRGGTFHEQATSAAASFADYLVSRDERIAAYDELDN